MYQFSRKEPTKINVCCYTLLAIFCCDFGGWYFCHLFKDSSISYCLEAEWDKNQARRGMTNLARNRTQDIPATAPTKATVEKKLLREKISTKTTCPIQCSHLSEDWESADGALRWEDPLLPRLLSTLCDSDVPRLDGVSSHTAVHQREALTDKWKSGRLSTVSCRMESPSLPNQLHQSHSLQCT